MSSGIRLGAPFLYPLSGGTYLSGVKVVAIHFQDYVPEHQVPALEGGITEREGHKADSIEIHGFLFSGSDNMKKQLQDYVGFLQHLDIPSTIRNSSGADYYFLVGDVEIDRIDFIQPAGRTYPYYEYVIRATVPTSGEVLFIGSSGGTSGTAGGIIIGFPLTLLPSSLIDYSQVLPVFASIHPDYSQVLPINITIHPDYSQVLPIGITVHPNYSQTLPIGVTEHPDYSQVLPLGASIHANYVRIS